MQNTSTNVQKILEDLNSADAGVVRTAAFAAGNAKVEEAIPILGTLLTSKNLGIQEGAEYAIRTIRGSKAVSTVLPLLRNDEVSVRNVAMDILREVGVDNLEAMHEFLQDPDADLRIFITDILGHCHERQAGSMLCEVLLDDPEINVRYQAAVSLGNLGLPETVDSLCKAIRDEEWVQFAVVESLTKIHADKTLIALMRMLPQASSLVASAIIDALGSMGNIKIIPLLFKALETSSVALRRKIVKAIVQILGEQQLSLLSPQMQERLRVYLLDALTDTDEEILLAALKGLSMMGNEDSTRAIFGVATRLDPDADSNLYEASIRAIASVGYNDAIRDAFHSHDDVQIMIAMEACQMIDDVRPLEEIKKIFWDLDIELQRAAVAEIAELGETKDVEFFKGIIAKSEDSEMLKNAIIFFGNQHGLAEAEDVVFSQLTHHLVDVKEMALEACINLHSEKLNERFKEMLHDEEDMKRMMAIYAMGRYSVKENLEEIASALEDPSPNVRQMAVEAFLNLGMESEQHLSRLLPRMYDENRNVRIALINLLGEIGTPAVQPRLLAALQDDNDWVRAKAIEAIGMNKMADAVPTLAEMLESSGPMLIFKIIEVLGKIGGNEAFSVLLRMMDHPDPEIQQAASDAVAALKADQE